MDKPYAFTIEQLETIMRAFWYAHLNNGGNTDGYEQAAEQFLRAIIDDERLGNKRFVRHLCKFN